MQNAPLRPLNAALAAKAAAELNENPREVALYLQALREWAQQQTHLRARTADQFLIVFLRAAKFSLEKAKQRLMNFYAYRATMPEIFAGRHVRDAKVRAINAAGGLVYLSEPVAANGPRVILMRPSCFDLRAHSIPDVFKVGSMLADLLLYTDDNAIVCGYIFIMDLAQVQRAVWCSFDPAFARRVTVLVNKALPTRMKSFHFLHVSPLFEKCFNMVKSVINAKLRERFFVHGSDLTSLYAHIPQRILPLEYGGDYDMRELQQRMWQLLLDNEPFFADEEQYGVLPGTAAGAANCAVEFNAPFGIAGSFRKLNLD